MLGDDHAPTLAARRRFEYARCRTSCDPARLDPKSGRRASPTRVPIRGSGYGDSPASRRQEARDDQRIILRRFSGARPLYAPPNLWHPEGTPAGCRIAAAEHHATGIERSAATGTGSYTDPRLWPALRPYPKSPAELLGAPPVACRRRRARARYTGHGQRKRRSKPPAAADTFDRSQPRRDATPASHATPRLATSAICTARSRCAPTRQGSAFGRCRSPWSVRTGGLRIDPGARSAIRLRAFTG